MRRDPNNKTHRSGDTVGENCSRLGSVRLSQDHALIQDVTPKPMGINEMDFDKRSKTTTALASRKHWPLTNTRNPKSGSARTFHLPLSRLTCIRKTSEPRGLTSKTAGQKQFSGEAAAAAHGGGDVRKMKRGAAVKTGPTGPGPTDEHSVHLHHRDFIVTPIVDQIGPIDSVSETEYYDLKNHFSEPQCKMTVLPLNSGKPRTCVTLNGSGIQLAVGPQPLWLRNHNSGLAHRIIVKRLETSPNDPLGITDSACKNQLVVVSVQYGPFNPYIPIKSTTIGKSRVAIDPIAMHTSWRSNSDIASIAYDIHACLRAVNPRQRCIDSYMHRGLTQSRRLMTPKHDTQQVCFWKFGLQCPTSPLLPPRKDPLLEDLILQLVYRPNPTTSSCENS
ncbi:exportin-1-like [Dorcoceras hygrometricum]|uniref:Exportin-1-like n=1 Tax=Dorcoceras hygrometricum TaxID=472368 RepID=A0A2Z7AWK3_9LAMI|nr:exportin-1-like [Dorcoceras hygrometricum]